MSRALRVLVPAAALVALASCSCSDDEATSRGPDPQGSVRTLSDADTILITDQLGSVLAETSGTGNVKGRFASYPYGVARYDTSTETRRYANAPRDTGVGLDLMGARFYAPELGVWTIGDPMAINSPNASVGSEFAAANPYAYSNLNPVIATDPDGNVANLVAGAMIGAGIGAALGAGIEAVRQYMVDGKVHDWGRIGAAAAGGAVSGAITGLCPAAGFWTVVAIGATSNGASGIVERLVASGGKDVGTPGDVIQDVAVGAITAGVLKGASKVIKRAPPVKPLAQKVQAPVKSAAGEWADVGDPLDGVMDRWHAEAACRSGGCKMPGAGSVPQALGRGSTANLSKGTTLARNLREQLAIEQAMSSPAAGTRLPLKMTDPRWPASEGWVKMQQIIQPGGERINVHYLFNQATGAIDDFKIVPPGPR